MPKAHPSNCPCDSGKPYSTCCELFHRGTPAPTAESLMRSRYSAYVFGLEDYLLNTWHPNTRPKSLDLANEGSTKWLGLEIKRTKNIDQNHATVEFVARYKIGSTQAQRLHEVSQFTFLDTWYYLTGEQH